MGTLGWRRNGRLPLRSAFCEQWMNWCPYWAKLRQLCLHAGCMRPLRWKSEIMRRIKKAELNPSRWRVGNGRENSQRQRKIVAHLSGDSWIVIPQSYGTCRVAHSMWAHQLAIIRQQAQLVLTTWVGGSGTRKGSVSRPYFNYRLGSDSLYLPLFLVRQD